MQVSMASTSYLQSISASGSIQGIQNTLSTLTTQINAIEDSNMDQNLKVEKTEAIEKQMRDLREQMEKIKQAREKIEHSKRDDVAQEYKKEAKNKSVNITSNGDEVRDDIIISASLNEEIHFISNSNE